MKRCKRCKVPLEGFLYRMIAAKLFGIRPSDKDADICNKCIGKSERPEKPKCSCVCCDKH
ncbi:MAG: hypothetical protein WC592_05975 [Candidatus Omnitrophota bacterium]|nr:hypothetical protein [Candidatus Omnitrophota bacterium]